MQPIRRALSGRSGLGAAIGPTAVGISAPVAGAATSAFVAGTSIGAWAGPIGAGVGALVGIIAGLWAAHDARAAGAKSENAAVGSAVQAFDASLSAVFQAANSGQVTGAQAVTICQQILQQYWTGIAPYTSGPGRSDASRGGSACSGLSCNKSCTAGCCVGCLDIAPSIQNCVNVLASPNGGTATILKVYASSYGLSARNSYTLTYTPPPAGSVAGIANALSSGSLTSALSTGTIAGLPLWAVLGGVALAIYAARQ